MLGATEFIKIARHCRKHAPYEAGGYIDVTGCFFVPMYNRCDDPTQGFEFVGVPDNASAIVHSHPYGPFYPSLMDQQQQIAIDVPWIIYAFDDKREEFFTFGDTAPIPPLVGRGYRYAVTDCYSASRDLYRVHCGVTLPHFPREWEWWCNGGNMLAQGYADAGFREVSKRDMTEGDALLLRIRSDVVNHAAVYVGDGLIYHHLSSTKESDPSRLAVVEGIGRWLPFIDGVVRHADSRIKGATWPVIRKKLSI